MSIYVNIQKNYGSFKLDVCFESKQGTMAIFGPSGSGKTLTLKCIAGIETPDKGIIVINGQTVFDSNKKINISPQKRRIGLMLQDYALFPNMNVKENIMIGAHYFKNENDQLNAFNSYIKKYCLENKLESRINELSGGEKQRVALVRMLMSNPSFLLFDEPFSSLDDNLRLKLQLDLKNELIKSKKEAIIVTHNKEEVLNIANSLAIIKSGRIIEMNETYQCINHHSFIETSFILGNQNHSRIINIESKYIKCLDWNIDISFPKVFKENSKYIEVPKEAFFPSSSSNHYSINVKDTIYINEEKMILCRFINQLEHSDDLLIPFNEQIVLEKAVGINYDKIRWLK